MLMTKKKMLQQDDVQFDDKCLFETPVYVYTSLLILHYCH